MCSKSTDYAKRPSSGRGVVTGWEWYVVDDERAANDVAVQASSTGVLAQTWFGRVVRAFR